jgi:hypothetical protein
MIDKPDIKGCIMNDQLCPFNKRQEIIFYLVKPVLDTETTGLESSLGHRIIEIGCVEIVDRKLTGNYFHVYINPDREIEAGAMEVHGITHEFLADKPRFQINNLHTTDLDNPMPQRGFQASGFGIQYDQS